MCVILGDNIFQSSITQMVESFKSSNKCAHVLLKDVHDPQRFGVASIDSNNTITEIVEKPIHPTSNLAVTGIYCYDHSVFNVIKTCKPSARGELEISDVNQYYVRQNQMSHSILDGWWSDAGTFESMAVANQLVKDQPVHE